MQKKMITFLYIVLYYRTEKEREKERERERKTSQKIGVTKTQCSQA
jgi:hypothetical protein